MTSARHDGHDAESLVGAAEAAVILGTSERTIRRKIAAGVLPSIKIGGQRRIPVSALDLSHNHDDGAPPVSENHDGLRVTLTPSAVVTPPVIDLSPLTAIIERQAQEIARLSGALATAEERLRAIEAGPVMTDDTKNMTAEPPATTGEPRSGFREWWRRLWGGS